MGLARIYRTPNLKFLASPVPKIRRQLFATWHENGTNFGFYGPVSFRGHFEEIGIVKVLLNTKPRRVGEFRGCRFSDV